MWTGAPVHGGGGQYLRGHAGCGMVLVTGREWGCAGNLRICGGSDRGAFRPVVNSGLPVFPAVRRIEMSSVDAADDVAGDSSINLQVGMGYEGAQRPPRRPPQRPSRLTTLPSSAAPRNVGVVIVSA